MDMSLQLLFNTTPVTSEKTAVVKYNMFTVNAV